MPLELELCPGRWVGGQHPCFIIAEIGQNHQGDLDVAKRMIRVAKVREALRDTGVPGGAGPGKGRLASGAPRRGGAAGSRDHLPLPLRLGMMSALPSPFLSFSNSLLHSFSILTCLHYCNCFPT